jgi:hypothetical protein
MKMGYVLFETVGFLKIASVRCMELATNSIRSASTPVRELIFSKRQTPPCNSAHACTNGSPNSYLRATIEKIRQNLSWYPHSPSSSSLYPHPV